MKKFKLLKYKFKRKGAYSWQAVTSWKLNLIDTKSHQMVPTPPREKPAQLYSATFVNIRIKKVVFVSPLP